MPQPAWQQQAPAQPPMQVMQAPAAAVAPRPVQGGFVGLLRDQQFESKVMLGAAAALFVSRFIPMGKHGDSMVWAWSGDGGMVFRIMVWALIAALVYGATALAPPQTRAQLPAGLFSWTTFLIAYIGAGLTYTAAPLGVGFDGLALFAWVYPLFLAGLCARLQDPNDNIGRFLIGIGGLLSFIGGMIESKFIWHFEGTPGLYIVHNILFFVILLLTLAAMAFAIPAKLAPGLEKLEPFAKPVTAVLVGWVPVSLLLLTLGAWTRDGGKFVNFLLGFPHYLVLAVGYVGIALLAAPEAFDTLRKFVNASSQASAGQAWSPPPGIAGGQLPENPPPPPPLTVEQKLAELDAAWGRGGMSPEEYHQRRATIMAGK